MKQKTSSITPTIMRKSSLAKFERQLKWEKVKEEKAMNQIILARVADLTNTLIEVAINEKNPNAINSLLDRAFGKARQNIGLDGGAEDKPIVFMPASLMTKYAIKEGSYTELKNPGDDEPTGMLIEPHTDPQ